MDPWSAPAPTFVKQGPRRECVTLAMHANSNIELRQFLGHADVWDRAFYARRTIIDNVDQFSPELVDEIDAEVAERGHKLAGKTPLTQLIGRCDSFVVESDVRWPTDMSLPGTRSARESRWRRKCRTSSACRGGPYGKRMSRARRRRSIAFGRAGARPRRARKSISPSASRSSPG